jgi:trigger factor
MKVEVFDESPVVKRLEVEVEKEAVEAELSRAYKNLAGRVRLKGFRPGKVPVDIIRKQFGPRVHSEVTDRLLRASFGQAVKENEIQFVGTPTFEEVDLKPGEPFKYRVKVEVKPEIQIKNLKLGDVEKEKARLPEKAVEEELEGLRRRNSKVKSRAEEEASEEGDILTIDFLGKVDGVAFEGGAGKDVTIELGSHTFIPGFEEQLTGKKRGTHEVKVTFPESYQRQELAGKEALFEVIVKDIRQRVTPGLDDDFAKDLGEFESLQQLREKIEDELLMKVRDRVENKLKENLLKVALEKNPFDVPPSLIERQIDFTITETNRRLGAQGIDFRRFEVDMEKLREELRERAQFQVAASLLIEALARHEHIAISEADLSAHFEKLASASGEPPAKVAAYFRSPERLEPLKFQLLEEKVLDLLQSKATIVEVEPKPEESEAAEEKQGE